MCNPHGLHTWHLVISSAFSSIRSEETSLFCICKVQLPKCQTVFPNIWPNGIQIVHLHLPRFPCKFSGVPNLPYFSPTHHLGPGEAEAHLAFLQFRTEAFHGLKIREGFDRKKFWMFPIVILKPPGSLNIPSENIPSEKERLVFQPSIFQGRTVKLREGKCHFGENWMNMKLVVEPTHFKKICSSKIDHLPGKGENKKCLKPPPRYKYTDGLHVYIWTANAKNSKSG